MKIGKKKKEGSGTTGFVGRGKGGGLGGVWRGKWLGGRRRTGGGGERGAGGGKGLRDWGEGLEKVKKINFVLEGRKMKKKKKLK